MGQRIVNGVLILVFGAVLFGSGYLVGQSTWAPLQLLGSAASTPEEVREQFAPFWEMYLLIQGNYVDQPLDVDEMVEGAIDGMVATLDDPHTRYVSPENQLAEEERLSGEFQGIGATIESVDGAITIVAPFEGSPAEAAGLKTGDILRAADGVSLTGLDTSDAAELVRGPAGTTVLLLVERDGEEFEVEITRDRIRIESVRGEIIEGNIAYVRLSRFDTLSDEDMERIVTDLLGQNPIGMIVDVRGNGGGSLTTVLNIADLFLDQGIVVTESFGNGEEIVHRSDGNDVAEAIPLVILADGGSASASELLAAAIQDRDRGVVIGQTTYGKGTVQRWFSLANGGGARITIARWLTPDGSWIDADGVMPDYFIPLPEIEDGVEFEDTQLDAAVDYLQGNPIISVPPEDDEAALR